MGGGSPKVVHTLGGGLAKGVLGVYKGGGWVKNDPKRAYVICTQPLRPKISFELGARNRKINTDYHL